MLKSYLKSLSEDSQVSSKPEQEKNVSAHAGMVETPAETDKSQKGDTVSNNQSIHATNDTSVNCSIRYDDESSFDEKEKSRGLNKVVRNMTSESPSSRENEQSTTDSEDEPDTGDNEADGIEETDAIANRFEFLLEADETTETTLDVNQSTCDKTEFLQSTVSDNEAEPSEVSVSREASSRRKKTKRKQRRRRIASINDSIDDNNDDLDVILSEVHESSHDQVENGTNKSTAMNPLNMRVERKYLNYSTELKLKSLSASEAALFKRTLTTATRSNHNCSYSVNKSSLGNGSRYPSLSKSDASMQFDDDNPSAEHVLGLMSSLQGEKTVSSKKATRNLCNIQLFKIVHHDKYQQIQRQLLILVSKINYEMGNKLVEILSSYPCHVETLIQLACVVESSDEETSSVLTERAIIALESIFHPRFLASSNACRLDYRRRENRIYFITLLKHAQFISQVRKCHRASFELCKSLYTIDPLNDPLASLLILDHYALACGQYSWIIEIYQQSMQDKSIKDKLNHLPNWPYSVALAAYLSKQHALADQLINDALTLFPSMLRHLLDQCSVEPDDDLKNCEYFDFKKASNHLPKSLDLLILLYTRRSSCHWLADRKILIWLESRVRSFVQMYANRQSDLKSNESFYRHHPLPAKNITRHIILSGISSLIEKLTDPATVTKYFDPNPPVDEIQSYDLSLIRSTSEADSSETSDSVLSLFLKSLLPDYSVTDQSVKQAVARESIHPPTHSNNSTTAQAALTDASTTENLKSSVSSVLNAVRDLLSSMDPNDNNVQETSSPRVSNTTARNEE